MNYRTYQKNILKKAVKITGSAPKLDKLLGSPKNSVGQWLYTDRRIPKEYCIKLAQNFDFVNLEQIDPIFKAAKTLMK